MGVRKRDHGVTWVQIWRGKLGNGTLVEDTRVRIYIK